MASLVDRKVPTLLLFGEQDDAYRDFERAKAGALESILRTGRSTVAVDVVSAKLHGLRTIVAQELLVQRTMDWLAHAMDPVDA